MKQYFPNPRELDDLALLRSGALAPLAGFEGSDGQITLQVPPEIAADGALELVDAEGAPLARVSIESTYAAGELVGVVGGVTPCERGDFAFQQLLLDTGEVRQRYGPSTLTVPVDRALTVAGLRDIERAAAGRPVLLLALAGHNRPLGLSRTGLVRATLAAAGCLPAADVVVVPLARRDDPAADRRLLRRVVRAYAPGEIAECGGTGELPEAVAEVVRRERSGGLVVFFTGLSGSGKSTLARALCQIITERGRRAVTSLDGDVVRRNLSAGLTFSRQDRETNVRRIGWVAAEISRHGGVSVCSPIAPFDATRRQVRCMVEEAGGTFVLIHVATPLAECERRDRKGWYAKARRGEVAEFTGISSPYEVPRDADLRVDTTGRDVDDVMEDVLKVVCDRSQVLSRTKGAQ
ncbi:adenylyl-sulfate kinase [Amycolatopsis taiwanensis]|uniref:adenylyl-sulfate kinase n=1 Tax=Amycolatopsis taiwanensis TaxID=342230 RepID=UPI000693ACA0|nr:adenylyl-sulfate kinase [Amycolatopsis taiwanensis]